ncbi:MAG: acyltransferase, partial [Acidobacteriota bacterium]
MQHHTRPPHYRRELDGLRGIAILGVIGHHVAGGHVPGGYLGVDIFFVLSGYLITRMIWRRRRAGDFRLSAFVARRVRRLFPAYVTTILLVLVGAATLLPVHRMNDLGRSALLALLHLYNFHPPGRGGYFAAQAESYPLLHLWSLNVEEQIYVFWALVLGIVLPRTAPVLRWIAGIAAISLALATLYAAVPELRNWAFYRPEARLFEFCAGAALAIRELRRGELDLERREERPSTTLAHLVYASGLGVIVAAFLSRPLLPAPFHVLPACAGAALLIAWRPAGPWRRLVEARPLVGLGRISYSLYLVHWPLLVLYDDHSREPLTAGERWGLVVASVGASWLLWALVERRFRVVPGRTNLPDWTVARFAVALLAVAVTAAVAASLEPAESPRIRPPKGMVAASVEHTARPDPEVCTDRELVFGCTLNAEKRGRYDVLFIGDSLAAQLWPLASSLAEQGLKVRLFFEF